MDILIAILLVLLAWFVFENLLAVVLFAAAVAIVVYVLRMNNYWRK